VEAAVEDAAMSTFEICTIPLAEPFKTNLWKV